MLFHVFYIILHMSTSRFLSSCPLKNIESRYIMDLFNDIRVLEPSIKPILTLEEAKCVIEDKYGLSVEKIVQLNGYDDLNYLITIGNRMSDEIVNLNTKYVFKIINSLDSKDSAIFEAQTELLHYLEKNGDIIFPRPVMTKNENFLELITLSSGKHIIRLLEYIEGEILHKVTCPTELFYKLGYTVGKLDLAMKNFHHDAYDNRKHLWMLESIPQLSKFIFAVSNGGYRDMVTSIIKEFETRVLSVSNTLEQGLIHGDLNEQNIIVVKIGEKYEIRAIIDFGDTHIGCYLYELAITMAYMILTSENIETGGYILAGYDCAKKISEKEISLLKVCVAARLSQSLVMGAYSITQDPGNSYVLTTAGKGWAILTELWKYPEIELLDKWKRKLVE